MQEISARYGPHLGPVIGYRGIRSNFFEVGVTYAGGRHGVVGWEATVYSNLSPLKPLHGLSVGRLVGFACFEIGGRVNFLTNFDQHLLFLQPSVGLGIGGIATVNYGFQVPFGRNSFREQVSLHELRLVFRWPFW